MTKIRRDLRGALHALVINPLPPSVRGSILLDRSFCTSLGISPKFWLSLSGEDAVETSSLNDALRSAIGGRKSATLALQGGERRRVKLGRRRGGKATFILEGKKFSFDDADLLAADRKTRMSAVRRAFSDGPLLVEEEEAWIAIADQRPFSDDEFVELTTAVGGTPEAVHKRLQTPQNLDVEKLIPDEPRYYRRLTAPFGTTTNLDEFIRGDLASARKNLLERHPARALRRIALTALWQPLIPFDLLASVTVTAVASLLSANDPFTLLFGFELCSDRVNTDRGFVRLGTSFLEKLLLDADSCKSRCNIFSAVASISTINLRQAGRASRAPLFWVRLCGSLESRHASRAASNSSHEPVLCR